MTLPDLDDLLRRANEMQDQLAAARDGLAEIEIVGTARGGAVAVAVTVGGDFRFQSVRIDPEVHADGPAEVADAVLDALRDAADQVREHATRQLVGLQDLLGSVGGRWTPA